MASNAGLVTLSNWFSTLIESVVTDLGLWPWMAVAEAGSPPSQTCFIGR